MGTQDFGISLPTTGALFPVDPHHYSDLRRSREVQTGFERFCLLKHFISLFQSPSATHSFPDSPAHSCRCYCLVFCPHSSQSPAPSIFQEGQLPEHTPTPCPSRRECPLHLRFLSLRTFPPAPWVVDDLPVAVPPSTVPPHLGNALSSLCPSPDQSEQNLGGSCSFYKLHGESSRSLLPGPPHPAHLLDLRKTHF